MPAERPFGRRALLSFGVALATGPREARANDPVAALLDSIQRARADVRTLSGPFTQTRTIGLLATAVRSTGSLVLDRTTQRLRWELDPPDAIVYWVTPAGIAYRSAGGQGRVRAPTPALSAALDDLRTLLGGDLDALRARYDLATDSAPGNAHPVLVATPHGAGGGTADVDAGAGVLFRRIECTLGADRALPERIVLVESARDRSVIELGALQKNAPVDPARMQPPA
jgi:hypothetical protein